MVQPYFDYCLPLWDNCDKVLQDKLQKFQNRAARIITGASYDVRSADMLDTLGWKTLDARQLRNKSILMYKILNDHTASNLKDLFRKKYKTHQNAFNLRNSETDLMLAKPKTEFLKRTFGYRGATLWNNLPQELKLAESISSFKKQIQQI